MLSSSEMNHGTHILSAWVSGIICFCLSHGPRTETNYSKHVNAGNVWVSTSKLLGQTRSDAYPLPPPLPAVRFVWLLSAVLPGCKITARSRCSIVRARRSGPPPLDFSNIKNMRLARPSLLEGCGGLPVQWMLARNRQMRIIQNAILWHFFFKDGDAGGGLKDDGGTGQLLGD